MRVCSPVTLNCDVCYSLTLLFENLMPVPAGLAPASTVYLWITDKFGIQYSEAVIAASDGSFVIDASNYPESLFNPLGGTFDIFLSSDPEGQSIVPMTFETEYNCLKLKTTCTINFDPDALALINRMNPMPDLARQNQINNFFIGLKTDGNYNKLDYLYFLAAHSAQAATLNWISTSYTLVPVASPVFEVDRGYTSDGAASYLKTGYNALINGVRNTINSGSFGFYGRTWSASDGSYSIGTYTGSQNSTIGQSNSSIFDSINQNGETGISHPVDKVGLCSISRVTDQVNCYHRGLAIGSSPYTTAAAGFPNLEDYLLAVNIASAPGVFSVQQGCFAFKGSGDIDHLKLYNRVQFYLMALGADV